MCDVAMNVRHDGPIELMYAWNKELRKVTLFHTNANAICNKVYYKVV